MRVTRATSVEAALEDAEATLLAGGTDLMVAINFGRERPSHVVSIRNLPEISALELGERASCGGGVTYTRLLGALGGTNPALAQAVSTIGSPQIRNAGTIGGNLGTCSPAGDTLPVLAALDAGIRLRSLAGERRVAFADYMLGPRRSARRPGELVSAVEWEDAGAAQVFMKAGTRNAMVIAVASLAMVIDRRRQRVRVALGSVGPVVLRAPAAEGFAESLLGEAGWERPLQPSPAAVAKFGELVAAASAPIDDQRGTQLYRRHVVGVMAGRALRRTAAIP